MCKVESFSSPFPHHQIITTTINYDRFSGVIYEFSLRGELLTAVETEKETHKVRGRLIVMYWRRLVLSRNNIKVFFRASERWFMGRGKNFRFSLASFHAIKKFAHLPWNINMAFESSIKKRNPKIARCLIANKNNGLGDQVPDGCPGDSINYPKWNYLQPAAHWSAFISARMAL